MEEDQKLEIKVKSEMVVEIPVKRSSRASVAKKPRYTEDEEVDELEDKKPIIKDFATSRKRKGESFLKRRIQLDSTELPELSPLHSDERNGPQRPRRTDHQEGDFFLKPSNSYC